ncbi:MAG: tetratricopeptide repeat protein [Deltaproteobacteria bacterium]|nr:tetratricopeptide repeat protein [Deltaproteobacteria bacterium]
MRSKNSSLQARLASPIAMVLVALLALFCGFFPLTGTPGFEAAQILAAVGGPLMLISASIRGSDSNARGYIGDFWVQSAIVVTALFLFMGIVALASVGHESCAPGRGYLPFFFFSVPVLFLHSGIGLWIGRLVGSFRLALLGALVVLAVGIGWLVGEWLVDPSFRVLSHLFVVIDGDLLRGRSITGAQVAFRVATLCYAMAVIFAGMARFPKARKGGLSSGASSGTYLLAAAVAFVCVGGATHYMASDSIAPSRSELEQAYSLQIKRGVLVVHADPLAHSQQDVAAVLAEGNLWMHRLQERMGVKPSAEINIYLHKNRKVLGHYTGAEHVHFALPSRRELHISGTEVPHRSLGHELAHVLAAEMSDTLLGVPAELGFLVNTGLVEGLAMAVTPELEIDRGLTLMEKAAALEQNAMAIPPAQLFSSRTSFFHFWTQNAGNSYTSAGALVSSLLAEKGAEGLQKAYAAGDLLVAFDDDPGALAKFLEAHVKRLQTMPLPQDARATVAKRYQRPSLLNQTCSSEAMAAADEVAAMANQGQFEKAEARLRQEQEGNEGIDGDNLRMLARVARRLGEKERAAHYALARMHAQDKPSAQEAALRANDAADALWALSRHREASVLWARVDGLQLSPGLQRLVWAKRLFAEELLARAQRAPVAAAGMNLLMLAPDSSQVLARVSLLSAAVEHARGNRVESSRSVELGRYLLARQYGHQGLTDESVLAFLEVFSDDTIRFPSMVQEQVLFGVALGHGRRGDLAIGVAGMDVVSESTSRSAHRVQYRDLKDRMQRMAKSKNDGDSAGDRWLLGREVTP